jgi:hypothetical protein
MSSLLINTIGTVFIFLTVFYGNVLQSRHIKRLGETIKKLNGALDIERASLIRAFKGLGEIAGKSPMSVDTKEAADMAVEFYIAAAKCVNDISKIRAEK